jgi:hypothetical protein
LFCVSRIEKEKPKMTFQELRAGWGLGGLIALIVLVVCIVCMVFGRALSPPAILGMLAALALARLT